MVHGFGDGGGVGGHHNLVKTESKVAYIVSQNLEEKKYIHI